MIEARISVALTSYNGSRFLQEQIDSIVKQSITPFEIVICDDRSTDETEKLLSSIIEGSDIPIKFIVNENRLGPIKNFVKAINLCSGDYVALCDQDDVWHLNKLEETLRMMRITESDNSIPCLVFSDSELVDENLNSLSRTVWQNLHVSIFKHTFNEQLFFNPILGCTMMFNQSLKFYLKEIPSQAKMHDAWIALIAYSLGKVGILNQPTMKYRRHSGNVTINQKITIWNRIIAIVGEAINERKNYMESEFQQAEKFYQLYSPLLNKTDLNSLTKFLSLQKSSFIKIRLARFRARNR